MNSAIFKCMSVSVCMLLLETATFALGSDDATKRIIQTQTDLIRHKPTGHHRRTAGQNAQAKRLTNKQGLTKKHVRTASTTD
ncbi:MAG: hypothetical protein JOZ08_21240 [Verrucomicrobia bacterium]|nr:hypothetical protein [Verrucomicrobiota bacterium]MBV8276038.1 hypothetical protein [Verrucomicrobiota bacterium]